MIVPLAPDQLYRHCDAASLPFDTTAQLAEPAGTVGQDRALGAVKFSLEMQHPGFNLFVLGPQGTGKHGMIRRFLELRAHVEAAPDNWCYVNNFSAPVKPIALKLPPGWGLQLRTDMTQLVEELQSAMLESEDYRKRVDQIDAEFDALQKNSINALADECETQDIALSQTETGFSFDPAAPERPAVGSRILGQIEARRNCGKQDRGHGIQRQRAARGVQRPAGGRQFRAGFGQFQGVPQARRPVPDPRQYDAGADRAAATQPPQQKR